MELNKITDREKESLISFASFQNKLYGYQLYISKFAIFLISKLMLYYKVGHNKSLKSLQDVICSFCIVNCSNFIIYRPQYSMPQPCILPLLLPYDLFKSKNGFEVRHSENSNFYTVSESNDFLISFDFFLFSKNYFVSSPLGVQGLILQRHMAKGPF